jgi:CDP-diacylglycerol--glycerol-3-phosphate 3-phosphatidyltransferase
LTTAILFTVAAITDWFDGYLARKWGQTTPFGAFLDPVADKLIVAAALVILVERHETVWLTIPAVIIIGREIVISALREWMAEVGKRSSVAVNMIGKLKTTMQMVSIVVLLSQKPGTAIADIGLIALQVAAVLTLWSMIVYLNAAWSELKPSAK